MVSDRSDGNDRAGHMETFPLKLIELKSISVNGVAAIARCDHNLLALNLFRRSKQSRG